MRASFRWVRGLFELAGAVTLLLSAGVGTAVAAIATALARRPSLLPIYAKTANARLRRWNERNAADDQPGDVDVDNATRIKALLMRRTNGRRSAWMRTSKGCRQLAIASVTEAHAPLAGQPDVWPATVHGHSRGQAAGTRETPSRRDLLRGPTAPRRMACR